MNKKAWDYVLDRLGEFSIIILCEDTKLYHGARSLDKIENFRTNAMFTTGLNRGVDYAFKVDIKAYKNNKVVYENNLYRTLFCVRNKRPLKLVEIINISFNVVCSELNKLDPTIELHDIWVQSEDGLISCLKSIYGPIDGFVFKSGNKGSSTFDEFIFCDAPEVLNVTRRID